MEKRLYFVFEYGSLEDEHGMLGNFALVYANDSDEDIIREFCNAEGRELMSEDDFYYSYGIQEVPTINGKLIDLIQLGGRL